jgi:hypothetical protein
VVLINRIASRERARDSDFFIEEKRARDRKA